MAPVPGIGAVELTFWRLDLAHHAKEWDSGVGARTYGGRWNGKGAAAVYCALDPATAVLEVAVHKGFELLDTQPHVLTCARVDDLATVHVVRPEDVPNASWLVPGSPSAGQQEFGQRLLAAHPFVLLPSVVSARSWNLLVNPGIASGLYTVLEQAAFAFDPRLHAP
jgi:RES domain-containing protein